MSKDQNEEVERSNRYDVTILINGLPGVQIELKSPGAEINEAINQINRYRKYSFKGLFHYLQLFVISTSVMTKYFWTDAQNRRVNSLDDFTERIQEGHHKEEEAEGSAADRYPPGGQHVPDRLRYQALQHAVSGQKSDLALSRSGLQPYEPGLQEDEDVRTGIPFRNIRKWQDEVLTLFSGDGNPSAFLLDTYENYVKQWVDQVAELRSVAPDVASAGNLKSEDDIRMFIIAFRTLSHTPATLKTFSRFTWDDLAVVLREEEYDGYKSWYLYYKEEGKNPNPKVPVPVAVDFDIELVRTGRINVMYILNLLKRIKNAGRTEEERQAAVDPVLKEIGRSDNENLRRKSEILKNFILNRFHVLPEDVDIMAAFEEFEKESIQAGMESFAFSNGIELKDVAMFIHDCFFSLHISEDEIRKAPGKYKPGILRMTEMAEKIRDFVEYIYAK